MPDPQPPVPRRRPPRTFAQLALERGTFDNPPASGSESPTARDIRRSRLRRALQSTADLARDLASSLAEERQSRSLVPMRRRRQRSSSEEDEREVGERGASFSNANLSGRRIKRSKTHHSPPPLRQVRGIKYGYYGQVEPGRLQLALISCDGGEHSDRKYPGICLGPQNVLKLDKSVYCSERRSSSLMLRHTDDSPFCLDKLHILGPEHGFTAPVREGLVYVAMSLHELQRYIDPPPHARRLGVDTPPYRRSSSRTSGRPSDIENTWRGSRVRSATGSEERGLTLRDALQDPTINAAFESRQAEREGEHGSHEQQYDEQHTLVTGDNDDYYGEDFGFGRTDPEAHCDIPNPADVTAELLAQHEPRRPPGVALLSDDSPGPEDVSSQEVLDFRLNRLRNMRRRHEIENWDRDDRLASLSALPPPNGDDNNRDTTLSRLDMLMHRSRIYDSPQREDPASSVQTPANPHVALWKSEEWNGTDGQVVATRFQIRNGKYKVAIKFVPPVSGRFILLKLWANQSNVDVQSVVAEGFGGCRFFPAVDMR